MLFFFSLLLNAYFVIGCKDCYSMGTYKNQEVFVCPQQPTSQNININININIPHFERKIDVPEDMKDTIFSKINNSQNITYFENNTSLQNTSTPSSSYNSLINTTYTSIVPSSSNVPSSVVPSSSNVPSPVEPSSIITPSPSNLQLYPSVAPSSSKVIKEDKNNLRGSTNKTNTTQTLVEEIVEQYLNKNKTTPVAPKVIKEQNIAIIVSLSVTITMFVMSLLMILLYKYKLKHKVHGVEKVEIDTAGFRKKFEELKNRKISKNNPSTPKGSDVPKPPGKRKLPPQRKRLVKDPPPGMGYKKGDPAPEPNKIVRKKPLNVQNPRPPDTAAVTLKNSVKPPTISIKKD